MQFRIPRHDKNKLYLEYIGDCLQNPVNDSRILEARKEYWIKFNKIYTQWTEP